MVILHLLNGMILQAGEVFWRFFGEGFGATQENPGLVSVVFHQPIWKICEPSTWIMQKPQGSAFWKFDQKERFEERHLESTSFTNTRHHYQLLNSSPSNAVLVVLVEISVSLLWFKTGSTTMCFLTIPWNYPPTSNSGHQESAIFSRESL